tara:strand:- start:5932 stop:6864 length:933 start_codon:yes stop_codon:yes gene_type:complete
MLKILMFKLPSKKFILVVIFTAVFGTGVFFLFDIFKKETVFTQDDIERPSFSATSMQDSDGDGLKDWEEQLLGTNPFENDIDNAQILTGDARRAEPLGGASETQNITEAFSRELLTSLLFTEETTLNEEDITLALDSLLSDATVYITPRIYTEKGARTVNNTNETFKTYGNTFMATVAKHPSANADDTLVTFEHVLKTRDDNATETLDAIANEYSKLESDLLSLSVPQEIVSLHIDFVNGVHALSQAVSDMRMILHDPLRATLGLSMYLKQLDREWEILRNIQTIFQTEGIIFNEGESGYVWVLFQLPLK